ncbi:MAG: DUF4091 domain-containing protein, partial [Deltaproteobacteria bacterium]|nr:DUF4091 domain-containing protein [Deltaproteobacteria bacterium]MBW2533075.1 DUF4091 domain-containing protein [Deltaproteobacteria bacterium]
IVVAGGAGGVTGVTATASALTGPGSASIPVEQVMLYQAALYQVVTPSNTEGAAGPWPDPLIPAVDAYEAETRNAFPFDVAASESRVIWVEVLVPPATPAGTYTGTVSVEGTGLTTTEIAVSLRVRGFELPSTATLKSAFGVSWNVCAAHLGSYANCGDAGIEQYQVLYGRAALDHRISLESVVYYGPDGSDWSRFDGLYGPLLDGTAATRLAGARQTTMRLMTSDPGEMALWQSHFSAEGWLDRLFDYTCDEPPIGCAFSEIATRAAPVHAAGIRTLVTTDIDEMEAENLSDHIDIAVPIVNYMHEEGGSPRRADYDAFLASSADKELWMYQSCMSHGCGNGCVETTDDYWTGWPSYMIDASALQNRAMEWMSFQYDLTGELYFQSTHMLSTAWDDQCDFSGNGDGNLFYPGTPAQIGGTSHIPIESIRLKLIREGMEDFEYLVLLCQLGDCEMARSEAAALFPDPFTITDATPEELLATRARIADRIEQLSGSGGAGGAGGAGVGGSGTGNSGTGGSGASGDPGASPSEDDGGCGCRVGPAGRAGVTLLLLMTFAAAAAGRRRRK